MKYRLAVIVLLACFQLSVAQTTTTYNFTYPDRASFLADGWDFIGVTASGGSRNTEQTSGYVVSYDQVAHPGVLRIPVDVGDLWAGLNNTRNTLFRNLPSNWTSVRLRIASFAPTRNYQQAGLVVYQDDNNYVQITRIYEGGNNVTFVRETGGNASILNAVSQSATTNLYFRLDRDIATGAITSYYSLNGTSWTTMGSVTQTLNNPRLAIVVGASPGGYPNADIAWVEVSAQSSTPTLYLSPSNLSFSAIVNGTAPASQNVSITNGGTSEVLDWTSNENISWLSVAPQSGTTPGTLTVTVDQTGLAAGTYTGTITISSSGASNSPQVVNVTLTVISGAADALHTYPQTLVFNSVQGHSISDTRSLFIYTAEDDNINWNLSTNVSWLTPNTTSGVTEGTIQVVVNTNGLTAGLHNGNITISSTQPVADPVTVPVTLIINPNVPVTATTWKDGKDGAMSVCVDDGESSGFSVLQSSGFQGTYVCNGTSPPSFYTQYYNAGMELGSHLVSHPCYYVTDDVLRYQEIEPNIAGICDNTPQPCQNLITMVWPCGTTNNREQAVASEYFLGCRGYNINQLEDATPENFMNLKSYNSHEHTPYPPSDLKTVVDLAISQRKWFNLVLHTQTNDDGATIYASTRSIWGTSIGNVVKYILQRDRFILTNYNESPDRVTFNASRLAIPSSALKNFELAFGSNDVTTIQIDIDDSRTIGNVLVNSTENPYEIIDISGNDVLLTNIRLEPGVNKTVEVTYQGASSPTISLNPNNLSFSAIRNGTPPASQNVSITNTGTSDILSWTSSENISWLSVTPTGGTTPGSLTVSVDQTGLDAGTYNGTISISSAGASNSPQVVNVTLIVNSEGTGNLHYDFTYANRTSLLADGWDFMAVISSGGSRNTEQTSGYMVSYDQVTHPGVLRIPVDVGDLWNGLNNTRNSLFRNLPSNWTSARLRIASFAPSQNYQQAGLVIYQDDNNYVQITRIYEGGNNVTFVRETGGNASILNAVSQSATANLYFRLDRDIATGAITSYYSLNGSTWTTVGNVIQTINNPRLGIVVGASPGGYPNADIAWAEVYVASSTPALNVSPASLAFTCVINGTSPASQNVSITNSGTSDILSWTCSENISWLSVTPQSGTTPGNLTVSVDQTGLNAGTYNGTITISSSGVSNSPRTVNVSLTVNSEGTGNLHYDFNYANRTSLLADGWDFIGVTSAGGSRNTEQTSGYMVSYDQVTHPGVLRIPVDVGDLWEGLNNTRNSLFRNLPSNWTGARLKIASFAPTRNYQQAGLVAYQDDNNYVQITRIYEGGNYVTFVRETGGSASNLNYVSVSATTDLYFRLDRDIATGAITSYYSLNGSTWTTVGSVTQTLNNPRLAIIVGASPGGYPNADIAWAEVYTNTAKSDGSGITLQNTKPEIREVVPETETKLHQNYPNPFNTTTWIEYDLAEDAHVILELYNSFGQKIETVQNQNMSSGNHKISWDSGNYPSGIYYLTMKTGIFRSTIKMSILK